MESKHSSMKWKRPSPVIGISSTRSKSLIDLHLNRSGKVRNSDGPPNLLSFESHRKRPREVGQDSPEGNMLLTTLIKDLRVKRIFSPTSGPPEIVIEKSKIGSHEPDSGPKAAESDAVEVSGNGFSCSGKDMGDSKTSGIEKSKMGFVSEARKPDDVSLKPPVSEGIGGKLSPDVKENGVSLKVDKIETTKVLKPRQRVFKAPGSFSYRRLLPYLKNIAKDSSCVLDFCQQSSLDKGSEGKPFQAIRENVQDSSHETSNGHEQSLESPEYAPESPSVTVVDEPLSKPPVDGQTENSDMGFSCKVQKLNVSDPFSSAAVEDSQVNKEQEIGVHTDGYRNTPVEDVGTPDKVGNDFSGEVLNVEDICAKSCIMTDECHSSKDGEVGNADEILNQIGDSNEEAIQMTPPDAEILGKLDVSLKRTNRAGSVLQTTDEGLGKLSPGYNHRPTTSINANTQESSPKRKPVLNPCSRLKLFKSPGSVSYRRLLPYLMDIRKNNSGLNTVKDLEQRLLPPLTSNQQETPFGKSDGFRSHPQHQICDTITQSTPPLTTASGSSNDGGQNLTSPEHVTEFQRPLDLQKEQHVEQDVTSKQGTLETSPDIVCSGHEKDPPVTLLCPSTCEATSGKDGIGAVSLTKSLAHYPEEDYVGSRTTISNDGKSVQEDNLSQNSSQLDAIVSSGIHPVGPRKGILKRNPRGCRGLCTCLNCASFRLHAERAFEFSRNQMQDAEEVALNLMKEVSNLRKILEFSAVGANNQVMNLNEVKEACRKASEAEGLARDRLDEMNDDLNIHCRVTCLHEPRVTFANYIEEKSFQKQTFQAASHKP